METKNDNQWLNIKVGFEENLDTWVDAFILDRKAQNMSPGTIHFYTWKLKYFLNFCRNGEIERISEISPETIRKYILWLEEAGHNPGGTHQCFRALKAFLRWFELELEPKGWSNPIRNVKAPKISVEPLEPITIDQMQKLIEVCPKDTPAGIRDRALFLTLLDTGARASEVCSMNIADLDPVTGSLLIRLGKGRKPRTVFLGQKSRRTVRAYLKTRNDYLAALWATKNQERLTYWALNEILKRRATQAGIVKPELHAFRRAFALNMLRAGVDVYSLQELMGHADLQVLRRYLKQTSDDLRNAHRKGSPVDNLL